MNKYWIKNIRFHLIEWLVGKDSCLINVDITKPKDYIAMATKGATLFVRSSFVDGNICSINTNSGVVKSDK